MGLLRVFNTSLLLFVIFMIQELVIARINFPISGFSLYLAALMVVLALEDRAGSLVFGFIGGVILDFSPSADSPLGQWALVLTIIGYIYSINKESIGDFLDSPFLFLLFVSFATALSLSIFLIVGAMLGASNGSLLHNLLLIFANSLWTILITPLFLPIIIRVRKMLMSNRERI